MIHSNKHGTITKSGGSYYSEEGMTQKSGNTLFHPDGSMSNRSGENMIFGAYGTITVSGNMLFTPNGTYTLVGSILMGPDGESWTGITSSLPGKNSGNWRGKISRQPGTGCCRSCPITRLSEGSRPCRCLSLQQSTVLLSAAAMSWL